MQTVSCHCLNIQLELKEGSDTSQPVTAKRELVQIVSAYKQLRYLLTILEIFVTQKF